MPRSPSTPSTTLEETVAYGTITTNTCTLTAEAKSWRLVVCPSLLQNGRILRSRTAWRIGAKLITRRCVSSISQSIYRNRVLIVPFRVYRYVYKHGYANTLYVSATMPQVPLNVDKLRTVASSSAQVKMFEQWVTSGNEIEG